MRPDAHERAAEPERLVPGKFPEQFPKVAVRHTAVFFCRAYGMARTGLSAFCCIIRCIIGGATLSELDFDDASGMTWKI
jgi:hypothetical protein